MPKQDLRQSLLAARQGLSPAQREFAEHTLLLNLVQLLEAQGLLTKTIALYIPMRGEVDVTPVSFAIREAGGRACLPRTENKNAPLVFNLWAADDMLTEKDVWGIPVATGPAVTPDVVLTPLLGFDRTGHRLGYGAGNYDRTFASSAAKRIGIGFACQEVSTLPAEAHDIKLHAVVTEREVVMCIL